MDEYDRQWSGMQKYLPFLDKMIAKLERTRDQTKDPQLAKMKSLHHILTDTDKKLKLETLLKCQEVLVKLYQKVEGPPIPTPPSASPASPPAEPRPASRPTSPPRTASRPADRRPSHRPDEARAPRGERGNRSDRSDRPPRSESLDRRDPGSVSPHRTFRPAPGPTFPRGGMARPPAGRINPWQSSLGARPLRPGLDPWRPGPPHRAPRPFWRGGRGGFEPPFRGGFSRSGPPRELISPWSAPPTHGPRPGWLGPGGPRASHPDAFDEPVFDHGPGPIPNALRGRDRARDRVDFENRFGGSHDDYERDLIERPDFNRPFDRYRENGPVAHPRQPNYRSDRQLPDAFPERHPRSGTQARPSRWSSDDRIPPLAEREPHSHRDFRSDRRQSPSLVHRLPQKSPHPLDAKPRRDPRVSSSSVIESPASPPPETLSDSRLETPQSPPLETPLSPSPASPSPASPPSPRSIPMNTPMSPRANQPSVKLEPKVIPLERQSAPLSPSTTSSTTTTTTAVIPKIPKIRLDSTLGNGLLPLPTSQPRGNGLLPTPRTRLPLQPRPVAPQTLSSNRTVLSQDHRPPRHPLPSRGPPSDSQNSPFYMHKQFSTYGEYRKWKQEQDRLQLREQPEDPVPDSTTNGDASNSERNQAIASFKIPKKKRLNSADEPMSSKSFDESHDETAKESESDQSENELKVIENEDSQSESEDPSSPSSQKPKATHTEACLGSKDRTQQMLKNIVAALEPEEAKKLLQRANDLESAGKLSLKQLKYLLADDSDSDEPTPESKPTLKKALVPEESSSKQSVVHPSSGKPQKSSTKQKPPPPPPPPPASTVVVKKEPKDPDLSVFTGTEEIVFKRREFIRKDFENVSNVRSSVKTRIGALEGLLSKLNDETNDAPKEDPKPNAMTKATPEVEKVSTDIVDLGPMIVTRSPNTYTNHISSLIDQLKTNVKSIPDEREDLSGNPVQKVDLLTLVKGWQVDEIVFKAEESSLLAPDPHHTSLPADDSTFVASFSAKLEAERHSPDKLKDAKLAQLGPECISDLFKCAASHCAFSSDDAAEFLYHLDHIHACKPEQIDGDQCLECVLCLDQFFTSEMLVGHIVRAHGSAKFQCPYCYYRCGSKLSLMVHQQNLHPDSNHGYFECRGILGGEQEDDDDEAALPLFTCNKCGKLCESELDFYTHLEVHDPMGKQSDFVCPHCSRCCSNIQEFVFHSIQTHWDQPLKVLFRYFDLHARRLLEIEKTSAVSSDEYDVCEYDNEGLDSCDDLPEHKETQVAKEGFKSVSMETVDGLEGTDLFQCGGKNCDYAGEQVVQLKDHLVTCLMSQSSLSCPHCDMSFKHVPTLLEHLKTHGKKRYSCSLCSFRCSIPMVARNHGRTAHKVTSLKVVPLIPGKNHPERDLFLVTPKHALSKVGSQQDTFSPSELSKLSQRCSMSRVLLRCGDCDFSTKVRKNLEKHLKLHLKRAREPPTITPINPPSNEENHSFSKMTPLIDISEEEKAKAPLPEEEMAVLPMLVPETARFTCSDVECNYSTIDDFMLLNHIMALHPELSEYQCPHCPNNLAPVPLDDLEFHLRCHGDLLFRCGHCHYFHWQKRTAEKHVADEHPNRKQYVRDIRKEKEQIVPVPLPVEKKPVEKKPAEPFEYRPYKCSLCDVSESELAKIRDHCQSIHDMAHQYKCSMCQITSDSRVEVEKHILDAHPQHAKSVTPLRMFYIDPSNSDSSLDEKRDPLWSRNMSGLKHIRGILYDEEPTTTNPFKGDKSKAFFKASHSQSSQSGENPADIDSKVMDEADNFPMDCKECGIQKKTIKSLKMHIKLLHLRTGKFLCSRCQFSANILNSIHTHYKIQHPEAQSNPDFEERTNETKVFSHEYWNTHWNIPTLLERKAIVEERLGVGQQPPKKKKGRPKGSTKAAGVIGPLKRGRKRKEPPDHCEGTSSTTAQDIGKSSATSEPPISAEPQRPQGTADVLTTNSTLDKMTVAEAAPLPPPPPPPLLSALSPPPQALVSLDVGVGSQVLDKKTKERIMEISPFERTPTFKCAFCPKYSQIQEKLERHVRSEHSDKGGNPSDFKVLSRDQVVDMLTAKVGSTSDYKCFFCDDVIGPIYEIRDHFNAQHPNDSLKVRSFAGKGVKGYLECQLCGHLTPGFERSKQKAHFHEDHPLESSVSASKYVSKTGARTSIEKVDLSRFIGTTMFCPREDCKFEAKTLSAINNHLKKHTQTYKCGQCGKTHSNLSDFHQHTAMMHGDKIPDLVKDPEADAEFEALRGLFEAELIALEEADISSHSKPPTDNSTHKRQNVAKKSTSRQGKRSVARKSTGGARNLAPFSIYGLNIQPLNLNEISTRMSISGMEITLSAKKMSELIPLDPRVLVRDLSKEKREQQRRDEPSEHVMDTS
ncbi:hypothetical protein TCAL_15037 [Tigriopus californicus]|uniref:C2H2-type domain-containing protein n=1 Tax=Tigriopus californicus TaxID=6832 RepID=A0A553P0H0_TIGCA|nr:hypothetical protein TCAL_15037 [Tigriopus californicus]